MLSLLLVAAQAATAITSERDTGALDLLLVTDLTPREFIFGKLGGICYNTKEYLLPPLILAAVYAGTAVWPDRRAGSPELAPLMNFTAYLCVAVSLAVLLAFAMVLGIHVALRTLNSRLAVIHTLSTIFFLSVGTLVCMALILINGRFEYQWAQLRVLPGGGHRRLVVGAERRSSIDGAEHGELGLSHRSVLYTVMNAARGQARLGGVGRSH